MAKARGVPRHVRPNIPAATVVGAGEPIYSGEEMDLHPDILEARPPPSRLMSRGGAPAARNSRHRGLNASTQASINKVFEVNDPGDDEEDMYRHSEKRAGEGYGDEEAGLDDEEEEHSEHTGIARPAAHTTAAHRRTSTPTAAALPSPGRQQSKEAYRFLLDHIDAEIAALQRRHTTVTTRRKSAEERNSRRIKELFEFMESPWLLLPTDVPPPLPATDVDVYIKEQLIKKGPQGEHGSSSSERHGHDSNRGQSEGKDKMFVLASHKNFRSLPMAEKRFYEQAANFNATVRQEMKYRLATGCSRFEAFCEQVKECTPDMARAGKVPELPATWHHGGARQYQGLSRWQRNARQAQVAAAAAHTEEDAAATPSPTSASEEEVEAMGHRSRVHRPVKAAKRVKEVAAAAAGRATEPEPRRKTKTSPAPKKTMRKEDMAGIKRGRAATKPSGGSGGSSRRKVKADQAVQRESKNKRVPAMPSTRSASIPLPDMNSLASKRLKKSVALSTGKKKPTTKRSTKATNKRRK